MSSIPASLSAQLVGVSPIINPIDAIFAGINTSPYFTGLMMLLLNLGGRFLALEISKDQEKFMSQTYIRRFFLFAVLFVATRNVIIAASLAVVVILLLGYLFNENSELCLWKPCSHPPLAEPLTQQEGFQGLTPEEAMILKRLQDKQMAAKPSQEPAAAPVRIASASDIYASALSKLRSLV